MVLYREALAADDLACQSEWLKANVFPYLRGQRATSATMRNDILAFVGKEPEFWAYYADYDWVVLCQLFGRMIDLPKGWPMFCRDVKQLCVDVGDPKLPEQKTEHDALADAVWAKGAWEFLRGRQNQMASNALPAHGRKNGKHAESSP